MLHPKVFACAVIAVCAFSEPLSAQSCADLARAMGKSPDELVDGLTYVRVGSRWRELTSPTDLGLSGPTTLEGIHVVKDLTGQPRVGVVVIKTGRVGQITNASARRVALVRRGYNSCNPSVSVSSVSGEVYDGFHDYGYTNYDRNELAKLERFHTAFGKDCRQKTDDDPGGFGRHYSNRSQFSSTEDVVDYGSYTSLQAAWSRIHFIQPAVASPIIGKIDRETEIRSYTTNEVGYACLKVSIQYVDGGSFFRTNDLGAPLDLQFPRERRYWKRD